MASGSNGQVGTGRVFPTVFTPPLDNPAPRVLFQVRRNDAGFASRKILLFTFGSCLYSHKSKARAAWAVVGVPGLPNETTAISRRLQNKDRSSNSQSQNKHRAEIRAVIVALRCRNWVREGFKTVVIATSSFQTSRGPTQWLMGWVNNSWHKEDGHIIKNLDLWKTLHSEVERLDREGILVEIWKTGPESIHLARMAAVGEAAGGQDIDEWDDAF
ncbi:RNase H domain protein [Xylaria arbuscula]|nr:RNase H domain protein [Xylaria arbuscula]